MFYAINGQKKFFEHLFQNIIFLDLNKYFNYFYPLLFLPIYFPIPWNGNHIINLKNTVQISL